MNKLQMLDKLKAAGYTPHGGAVAVVDTGRIFVVPLYLPATDYGLAIEQITDGGLNIVSSGVFLQWSAHQGGQISILELGIAKRG